MRNLIYFHLVFIGFLFIACASQNEIVKQTPDKKAGLTLSENLINNIPDTFLTDIEGNSYPLVIIGDQLWMATNLNVSKYNNGTPILMYSGGGFLKPEEKGMYVLYKNEKANEEKYGKLYNFYAVNERNLCPEGWHVATEMDWQEMIGLNGLPKLNLLPGGSMNPGELSPFSGIGSAGYWWTSTSVGRNTAAYLSIQSETQELKRGGANTGNFFSMRCVKNKK